MDIPQFVRDGAFNWSVLGYHYTLSPEELRYVESGPVNGNPWLTVARVVERAKTGDFSEAGALARYFAPGLTTNIAPAALLITGDLGRKADLEALVEVMRKGPDGLRVYACQGARNAGCLWLVPHMLEAWHLAQSVDAHENIGYAIADLLDPVSKLDEEGAIASKAGRFTVPPPPDRAPSELRQLGSKVSDPSASKEFDDLVLKRWSEVAASCPDERSAIWAGRVTDVRAFAEHFLALITQEDFTIVNSPLTVPLREKFEASTGIDCSSFYRQGKFAQLPAAATLESFLDTVGPDAFESGRRYFFGHRIPDY
jgi:hypothetical protein